MKKFILFLAAGFVSVAAMAQDFPYGNVDNEALNMKKYDKDTSAHAVVLNEYGTSTIIVANDGYVKLIYQYHVKIKFFDKKEFDKGTAEIRLYTRDAQAPEEATDIEGITYYKDDNGTLQKAQLNKKQIFMTKENNSWMKLKFAMPGMRDGCIAEYKYTISSPYFENFQSWEFQSDIPKIYSEYEVHIPGFWTYNASLRGTLKLTKNKAELETSCFTFGTAKCDCSHMIYGISDIPAFTEEDYMTSSKNFLSAINFQLVEYVNIQGGAKIRYAKEWKDVDYQLKQDQFFGGQLKKKDLLKERVAPVIAGKSDDMDKARAIYTFIQKWYKWNEYTAIYTTDVIRKALDAHTGNVADINISLIAALNSAGINTEAVMLSTRAHGAVNDLYPSTGEFNYVVAKANIGGNSYFLDASDPLLSFGMLPMRCLNDKGRVFSLDKPSYWIDLGETKQRQNITYNFDLTLQENGKLKGTITRFSAGYSGYERRLEIKKFNTVDEYVENFESKLQKTKILKSSITNIDTLDKTVQEIYEVEIDAYDNINHSKFSFNPFLFNRVTTNPFKLAERDYPVDWGMPSDERYILTLHLPQQFTVENPPQSLAFAMPNQGGKFITDFQAMDNTFTFSHVTQFTRSIYGVEEYPYLKELYNKIILSEKNEIVLKKKS